MKYYAVKQGRIPGVYTTWAECEEQVKGYPGADYKKFNNEEDARVFVFGVTSLDENGQLNAVTTKEIKKSLEAILKGTQEKDTFEILKGVQDIAMLLDINIDGLSNVVDFM